MLITELIVNNDKIISTFFYSIHMKQLNCIIQSITYLHKYYVYSVNNTIVLLCSFMGSRKNQYPVPTKDFHQTFLLCIIYTILALCT